MSDFENTPNYQKGLIGEEIVAEFYRTLGGNPRRPDDSPENGASLVDFFVDRGSNPNFAPRFVEVKVKKPMRYAYGQYPCYSFPAVQIAAYKNYAQDKILELCIVDEERGKICCGRLDDSNDAGLERKVFIDGKEFPFEKETRKGLFRFYHVKQFLSEHEIAGYDLARLRAIKISDAEPDIPEVNRLGEAQSMVFDYLEIMLPDDLPIEEEKIPAF